MPETKTNIKKEKGFSIEEIKAIQHKTWLSETETVEYTGIHRDILRKYRTEGTHNAGTLPFVRIGKFVKYRRTDLDKFLNQHLVHSA